MIKTQRIIIQSLENPAYIVDNLRSMCEIETGKWEGEIWGMHLTQVKADLHIHGMNILSLKDAY